jgi:hypothetical protein
MLSSAKARLQHFISEFCVTLICAVMGQVVVVAGELALVHFAVHVLEKAVSRFFFAWSMACG